MSLAKIAQQKPFTDLLEGKDSNAASDKDFSDLTVIEFDEPDDLEDKAVTMLVTDPKDLETITEVVEDVVDEDDESALTFTLPFLPGSDIEEDDIQDLAVEEEEEKVEIAELDKWDWKGHGIANFPQWLRERATDCPKHTGQDTAGLERCISYFKELDSIIPKAVRSDIKGELSSGQMAQIEKVRDEINDGLERLEDRLSKIQDKYKKDKRKKKAGEVEEGLVKQAQKITGIKGIVVTVPLIISGIGRVCINGTVSAGHDIDDMFEKQSKKWKLTPRERFELAFFLDDCGFGLRRDRGFEPGEDTDTNSEDKFDWSPNFYN